jgi:beta-lactamase class A
MTCGKGPSASAVVGSVVTLALLAPTHAPAASFEAPPGWRPDVAAARDYSRARRGSVTFATAVPGRTWGYRADTTAPSASVLKAMLLVSYLNHPSVRNRSLRDADRRLISPMVRRSDNPTATRIWSFVGARRLSRLARRAGMRRFTPAPTRVWGQSRISADDQARFFLRIDRFVVARHRAAAMRLLRMVVPSQRWGVGQVAPRGWRLYFKGGWGLGAGAVDHQVALLERGRTRVAIAVLTTAQGTHAYGKESLRGVFKRLLRGL